MNLADNLKKIRKDNNLSQEQLAEKLGVSRQSVSKWESGLSYPEMDKVLQICQLFNLNINELINEDIKEVNEIKESQVRSNKYVTSFFDYITKTIDMFSSMKWKEKIKCLFEQCIIGCIIVGVLAIIGLIGSALLYSVLDLLPDALYFPLYHLFQTLYLVVAFIVGVAILLHIFKIRYLDYYEIVKEEVEVPVVEEVVTEVEAKKIEDEDNKKNKIILEKKKEKVVIRDPKHSEYKFFTGLGKLMLWCVKFLVGCILVGFVCTLIALVICLPICFLVAKSGLLFIGLVIGVVGAIACNVVILELLYNFIVNRKWNKTKIFVMSIIAFVMIGLGVGMVFASATKFNVEKRTYDVVESSFTLNMTEELVIYDHFYFDYDGEVNFIEKDINNVEIVIKHSDLFEANVWSCEDYAEMYVYTDDSNFMKYVRLVIDDLNNKIIGDYDKQAEVYVYANSENIVKLRENRRNFDGRIREYENRIEELEKDINTTNSNYQELVDIIGQSGYQITYDNEGNIISIGSYDEE